MPEGVSAMLISENIKHLHRRCNSLEVLVPNSDLQTGQLLHRGLGLQIHLLQKILKKTMTCIVDRFCSI
uniref:Uncharacterized protein n=1 Tax=Picea sitchensis TaxID=3332 RepID=D5A829_PICSI|nr:unknown [Picea sitchensis]